MRESEEKQHDRGPALDRLTRKPGAEDPHAHSEENERVLNARLFVVKRDHESNDSRLGCRDVVRCRISALRKCASAAFTKLLRSAATDCEKPPQCIKWRPVRA